MPRLSAVFLVLLLAACGSEPAVPPDDLDMAPAQEAAAPDVTGRADPVETEDVRTELDPIPAGQDSVSVGGE